ncbi:hypothetical protein [Pseudomonas taetrolens]|uniref:HNH endonuclease n=1 Tax=Pseudomonas taetrolens TaxID=47884 RepID=UPI0030DCAEFD
MKKIRMPTFTVAQALGSCLGSIKNEEFVSRLSAQELTLSDAEADYRAKGQDGQLYTIVETGSVGGTVSLEEMKIIYSNTFSRKNSPARYIYDAIRAAAPGGICPLCNQRVVSTLDHHLPKSRHAAFSITPMNLVPACKDCNTDSQARMPLSAGEQTLHPYFDSVDEELWLVGEVIPSSPPVIRFVAAPPVTWSIDKQAILIKHFQVFRLGELYSTHAAVELINIYQDIVYAGNLQNPQQISQHLSSLALRRRHPVLNSWQGAMYQALSTSAWFCEGGYTEISNSPLLGGFENA